LRSYTIYLKKDEKIYALINNIKEIVKQKLDNLINILFKDDKSAWCMTLEIQDSQNDIMKNYDQLIKTLTFMQNIKNIDNIPLSLIQSFSQNFLLTHELNIQINKLIVTNLNSMNYK
jgi:phosphate uptake regulator